MAGRSRRPFEILIFGAGAVGATFGWRLAQNPQVRVSVVCRSNYEDVKNDGVQMYTQLWGNGTFRPYRVARSVAELPELPFDYIVCANKIVRSNKAATEDAIRPAVRPATALVSLQNGINVEEPLRKAFAQNPILSALCYISCQQTSPGVVRQVSQIRPHAFHIGGFDHRQNDTDWHASGAQDRLSVDTERDALKVRDLVSLDARFQEVKDTSTERWIKMMFNGSWNPVAALAGCDTHEILQKPLLLSVVRQLAEEIYTVAVKSGAQLPFDLPVKTVSAAASAAPLVPSMLQDARHGREMEVEPICGNLLRQAKVVGVPVPTIAQTYERLQRKEREQQIVSMTSPSL